MANQNKTQQFNLEQAFALWPAKGKNGATYFTGNAGDTRIVAFTNGKKKNPKEPDIRLYTKAKDKLVDFGSLWCNVSEKGGQAKKYMSGSLINNKKVVGFINEQKEGSKRPYISGYYSAAGADQKQPQEPQQEKFEEATASFDLPF